MIDRSDHHGKRASRIFLLAFLVCFGAGAIWSAATPLLAAPDEPAQIVKAAAVAHGEWTGCFKYDTKLGHCVADPTNPDASEKLSAFFALVLAPDGADLSCFIHKPIVPASCERSLNRPASAFDVKYAYNQYAHTYVSRYPPLYYLVVGLPSRLGGSTIDLYLMRFISAALSAIFLAIAFTSAFVWSRNRLLLIGLLVASTPMVFFLAGVVNPSGLEISSAIGLWTTGAVLVTERLTRPPAGLLVLLVIAAATLSLSRSLSPFWLGCIAIFLAFAGPWRTLRQAFHDRRVVLAALAILIAAIGALAWIIPEHALLQYVGEHIGLPPTVSDWTIFETAFRHNSYYLADMVGVFGWFDAYSPLATYVIWSVLLITAIVASVRFAGMRALVVLGSLAAAVLLIPTVIVTSHAHRYGYNWSGRDALPLAVGLPIMAAALLGTHYSVERLTVVTRRIAPAAASAFVVAQFLAFYEALRRSAVGTRGSLFGFITHSSWHPAIGILPALGLDLVAMTALGALVIVAMRSGPP